MAHRFGRITLRQIILYTLLLLAATAVVVLYLMGGNRVFDEPEEEVKYREVAEVVLPMRNVKSLNPAASTDEDTYYIAPLIYDGLFRMDAAMSPRNDLAENYHFDRENSSITIQLKEVKWQDGRPLTAADVAFTVEAYKAAGKNCNYKMEMDRIGYVQGEGRSVTLFFNGETEMALDLLCFPILPSHRYDYVGEALQAEEDFLPVGTGQYQVDSYDPGGRLELVPNPNYHGEPAESRLIFDTEAMKGDPYQLLQAGGVSLMISRDPDRVTYITKKDIGITDFPANRLEFAGFNCKGQVFQHRSLRQAVCYAIDSQTIIERAFLGSGMLNDSLFYPGYLGIDSSQERYPFDTKKAQELLEEAGYDETDMQGYLVDALGNPLSIVLLVNTSSEESKAAADVVEESLKDLGFRVERSEQEEAAYYAALEAGAFDLYFGSYRFDGRMDMRELLGYEKKGNYAGYNNERLQHLLDDFRSGKTPEEMRSLLEEMREITMEEVPYYCICYDSFGAITTPSFQGELSPLWNDYYRGSGGWKSRFVLEEDEAEEAASETEEAQGGEEGEKVTEDAEE